MSDPEPKDEKDAGEGGSGGSSVPAEPTRSGRETGSLFIGGGCYDSLNAGVVFGKGRGGSTFVDFEFGNNPTDIISDGAAKQKFIRTKFSDNHAPTDTQADSSAKRSARTVGFSPRLKGKVCAVCGFKAFRWQTRCPKGHPLS